MEVDSSTGTAESIVVVVFPSVNVGLFFLFLVGRLQYVPLTFIRILPEKAQEL